jgi:hypothetical protein
VIPAVDALQLPSALLTHEDLAAVEKLETEIEVHVRRTMGRRGPEPFKTGEVRGNIIAEVNQRLRAAGWAPVWSQLGEQSRVTGKVTVIAYGLDLPPSDATYAAHRSLLAQ